jgi:hypothetical protein
MIKEVEGSVRTLGERLNETHKLFCEPHLEVLLEAIPSVIEGRKVKSTEYELESRKLQKKEIMSKYGVERGQELHIRHLGLEGSLKEIEKVTRETKVAGLFNLKLQVSLEEDFYTENEFETLKKKFQERENEILRLKREKEELQRRVVSFSRSISSSLGQTESDSISLASSSYPAATRKNMEEDKFDFPELLLLAQMAGDLNKTSGISRSLSKFDAVKQMLQRSEFYVERSLQKDYEIDELPDEMMEIVNSDEVKHSSIVIARLKGTQTNLDSIKVRLFFLEAECDTPLFFQLRQCLWTIIKRRCSFKLHFELVDQ